MDIFDYLRQICTIPRESGNEEGMRKYLLSWAKENGFEGLRDKAGNIIIRTGATPGYENIPYVALQAHMDMVCVKVPGSNHDFLKDPIEVFQDGDFLKANGTSLGGDDGIGVAIAMAIFTDPESKHGPLEAVFTFSEETGMNGAYGLDGSMVKSRRMINIDSEDEGTIFIGCAGGIDLIGKASYETEPVPAGWDTLEFSISGLKGGHSGGEIHKQHLNAICALSRMLLSIEETGVPFRLARFDGGTKRNVIPFSASCSICVPENIKHDVVGKVVETFNIIREENKYEEPGLSMDKKCSKHGATRFDKALDADTSMLVIKALFACPHGVFAMSKAIPGIVETSNNLAIARLNDGKLDLQVSVRSNIDSAKYYLVNRIKTGFESFGIECSTSDAYPSWNPDPYSKLARFCAQAYEEQTGKTAIVTAIHAGLECSVINSKCPGMDSVSIGPQMYDIHSTDERLSISSSIRTYEFIRHLLAIIE
ncbi:MAG: aminoacyl-histidine dipeptidase [Spirochaetales bacterium]|nr:aminoacyl-histidine dipeptidase [Spirochaetales bacterium]